MKICCVEGCPGPAKEDPIFFDFPTSRLLRKRWADAITAPSKLPQDAVVCIRHFRSEDYELVRGKTRLKSRVMPTLLVGDKPIINNGDTETSQGSTDTATSNGTTDNINNESTDNKNNESTISNQDKDGKIHNENEDNGIVHKDKEYNRIVHKGNGENGTLYNDTEKVDSNHEGNSRSGEDKDGNENVNFNSREVNGDKNTQSNDITEHAKNDKSHDDSEKGDDKIQSDTSKNNDIEKDEQNKTAENNKTVQDNEIVLENKIVQDNETVQDNKIVENNEIVQSDNGEVRKGRKTRCKITAMRAFTRRISRDSSDSSADSVSSSPPPPEIEGSKEDIEGLLTNYVIENKKTERQVAAMTDVLQEEMERREEERRLQERREEERMEMEDGWPFVETAPVFIELSVGQGPNASSQTENDCLMVLESVQCDVDPALLLAAREEGDDDIEEVDLGDDDDDDDEPVVVVRGSKKKEDPISLLTSSDDDDVIIQEQKIDTVEVSSADTSEDDMPLVKFVKKPKKSSLSKTKLSKKISKFLWGGRDFYCVHCRFNTTSASEYTKHMATHSKILQVCQECGFTTCSKAQLSKHKQKHKSERRFKCHRCNYSAKHKMSLIYHMKTHVTDVELAICDIELPSKVSKKSRKSEKSKAIEKIAVNRISIDDKRYRCGKCDYSTMRSSDMKRHTMRLHRTDSSDDDDYEP